jgi:hypothetical protein
VITAIGYLSAIDVTSTRSSMADVMNAANAVSVRITEIWILGIQSRSVMALTVSDRELAFIRTKVTRPAGLPLGEGFY